MSVVQESLLYSRVETVLASEIADGALKVGDQLPTEDSFIARFEVSRIIIRRAIQNLVGRGLVEIRRGKGTFVAAPKMTQELTELSGFVQDMHALGRKPTARVIGKEVVTADTTVASHLASLGVGKKIITARQSSRGGAAPPVQGSAAVLAQVVVDQLRRDGSCAQRRARSTPRYIGWRKRAGFSRSGSRKTPVAAPGFTS